MVTVDARFLSRIAMEEGIGSLGLNSPASGRSTTPQPMSDTERAAWTDDRSDGVAARSLTPRKWVPSVGPLSWVMLYIGS